MIIGKNRPAVIENIKTAIKNSEFLAKVEINDPNPTEEECRDITDRFMKNQNKPGFKVKSATSCLIADIGTAILNKDTEIVGAEKVENIDGGVIITSNHFSPIENTVVRKYVNRHLKKKLCIVSQISNFAMTGPIGFLMNYTNTIPLWLNMHYIAHDFNNILEKHLQKGEAVLIYPEQEMWFNYRKPRPSQTGAYRFAAKFNVPIISCFVEIIDLPEMDTEEFCKVKYRIHILDVLKPDSDLPIRQSARNMCEQDYRLKKEAYERIYQKELSYEFDASDIAGWKHEKISL